jgi:AraC-like DNA-binding protein
MYSYLFFALALLGLFSILQILREDKIITKFKVHILLFLIAITIVNLIDFTVEIGYNSLQIEPLFRLFTTLTLMNVFILLGRNKISKLLFTIEIIISIIYFIAILSYSDQPIIKKDDYLLYNKEYRILHLIVHILFISNIIYTLIKIYFNNDTINLYQRRIKKWASLSFIFFLIVIGLLILVGVSVINKKQIQYSDARLSLVILRLCGILFILFRPNHIDEIGIPFYKGLFKRNKGKMIQNQDFEFVFYSNYYYLKSDANLEDFALKLNHTIIDVKEYIYTLDEGNFNELLNKYRVIYFTELLKNKKYESLTIEALSELSGFGSRKTMYNVFNKYHGMTPTEFITIHK